jgi:DNA-binding CsgD family transcriptional regulator
MAKSNLITALVLFAACLIFLIFDITEDWMHGLGWLHILSESLIAILATIGIYALIFRYKKLKINYVATVNDNLNLRNDNLSLKVANENLVRDIQFRMDQTMRKWQLTEAEKLVAILVIKGLSNKEIANLRQTSESTIRQQTTSIYKKANLHTRSELSAYFLENLLQT